ncbi:hypothetical protein Lal_00025354 [Lupinus albus]|nr:hypothetical protein Lal_00025354 [Lupinus albus]
MIGDPKEYHPGQQRNLDTGGSLVEDPYYTPPMQVERLAKFMEYGFQFPLELEVQEANTFLELHGNIYPSLVREFYGNFQYKDG